MTDTEPRGLPPRERRDARNESESEPNPEIDPEIDFRILIVDDNPRNLQLLGRILDQKGYPTAFAMDGERALEMVASDRYDLILLDVMMPKMDGFEVCRRLRADPVTREIPVVFLTARNDPESVVAGFEVGAVDYIVKPFHSRELLARVATRKALRDAERDRMERASLQAVLELAGAVCHEFNQPLQVVSGTVELLRFRKIGDDKLRESLDRIQRQVERLGALTRKLGGITRRETREYVAGTRILDLDRSAPGADENPDPDLPNRENSGNPLEKEGRS